MAAATRSILLPVWTSICSKIVRAFWLSQPGTNCSGPFLKVSFALKSGFRIASFPLLKRNELSSVAPPSQLGDDRHFDRTSPFALRPATTPLPCRTPTALPSKEM